MFPVIQWKNWNWHKKMWSQNKNHLLNLIHIARPICYIAYPRKLFLYEQWRVNGRRKKSRSFGSKSANHLLWRIFVYLEVPLILRNNSLYSTLKQFSNNFTKIVLCLYTKSAGWPISQNPYTEQDTPLKKFQTRFEGFSIEKKW